MISLLGAAARVSARAIEFVFHEKFRDGQSVSLTLNELNVNGDMRSDTEGAVGCIAWLDLWLVKEPPHASFDSFTRLNA